MKWKKIFLSGASVAVAFLTAGCSNPSVIQVTGTRAVRSEMQSETVSDGDEQVLDDILQASGGAEQTPDGSRQVSGGAEQVPDDTVRSSDGAGQVAVYVCGAVNEPGVYYLPSGSRICDAISAAQGFTDDADGQWLNQAQALYDGQMLVAYTKEETDAMRQLSFSPGSTSPEDSGSGDAHPADATNPGDAYAMPRNLAQGGGLGTDSGLVNLNTASKEQLTTLPGIGEAKADAIIRYRTETGWFASTEDVMNVSGIKNSTYEKIRSLITV